MARRASANESQISSRSRAMSSVSMAYMQHPVGVGCRAFCLTLPDASVHASGFEKITPIIGGVPAHPLPPWPD
eukprot:scaffold121752_cov29-Tisochrysis_lutea.AAC.7